MNSCIRATDAIQKSAAAFNPGVWQEPKTILLVEDEAFVRAVTAEVLESAGYKVVSAKCSAEALEACRRCSQPIDMLLSDIVLPEMNGQELARSFGRFFPRAGVLLMSGHGDQLHQCEQSVHPAIYLAKPFSAGTLLSKIREVFDKNLLPCPAPFSSRQFCDIAWPAEFHE